MTWNPADPFPVAGSVNTRIYCLPTCPYGPRVLPKNLRTFATIAEAREAGYRACKVCKPDDEAAGAAQPARGAGQA